jgi:hypothetical protein
MLTHTLLKDDLYRLCGVTSSTARADVIAAVGQAINRAQARFALAHDWSFLEQYQDRVDIALAAPYTTGTVTVTQDSKAIVGDGTAWTKDMEGDYFRLTGEEFYEIRSWTSATAMTLALPYQGSGGSGEDHQILKRFYPLPLNFLRAKARDAKLTQPGNGNSQSLMCHARGAASLDKLDTGRPQWFTVAGNHRRAAYFDTGTVTVATTGGVSTWTISTGTLPTDIVDREVRVAGESASYLINARTGATTFTTYDAYVNPSDLTGAVSAASYAITPKETLLVAFSHVADQRYIFTLPYIKRLPDLLAASDVSEISKAGYDDALLAVCRAALATDFRTLLARDGDRQALIAEGAAAVAEAWASEQHGETMQEQADGGRVDRRQAAPSWI